MNQDRVMNFFRKRENIFKCDEKRCYLLPLMGDFVSELVCLFEGGGVVFDGAFLVGFVEEEVVVVFHFEGVEEPFHHEFGAVEEVAAAATADGDKNGASRASWGVEEGLFEYIASGPEHLAAVDEHFCLGTDGHEVDGAGEDQSVGLD